jgi:ATP-dependent Lhr-like helicase
VLDDQLELYRLQQALKRAGGQEFIHINTPRPGPLAFPLLVERLNNRMSNESVLERVQRMMKEAERLEA